MLFSGKEVIFYSLCTFLRLKRVFFQLQVLIFNSHLEEDEVKELKDQSRKVLTNETNHLAHMQQSHFNVYNIQFPQ